MKMGKWHSKFVCIYAICASFFELEREVRRVWDESGMACACRVWSASICEHTIPVLALAPAGHRGLVHDTCAARERARVDTVGAERGGAEGLAQRLVVFGPVLQPRAARV